MPPASLKLRIIDETSAVEGLTADYMPFGVKVLKLAVENAGDAPVKLWLRPERLARAADPCAIYGLADDGDDLWVLWGAGDVLGCGVNYQETVAAKANQPLPPGERRTVHLHLFHRPADPASHVLHARSLTVEAVTSTADPKALGRRPCAERDYPETVLAAWTFQLTVPAGAQDPLRPMWRWGEAGSRITFAGADVARYVSRWWPARAVEFGRPASPPAVSLSFARGRGGRGGAITATLQTEAGEVLLAKVDGGLAAPLHDLRWLLPELQRFYDHQYVLRLWFFWPQERISAEDLLAYVPDDARRRLEPGYRQEAEELMARRMFGLWPGWGEQYEIPDVERFDIVFDPRDTWLKHGCTDRHWQELWYAVPGDEPLMAHIAPPQSAGWKAAVEFLKGLGHPPPPIANPLRNPGVLAAMTGGRCISCPSCGQIACGERLAPAACPRCGTDLTGTRGVGMLGKNPPFIQNGDLLVGGVSSDVLKG